MNIWRMKLRAGNYGEDMFPACRERGIAAMTHPPIFNVDLTHTRKGDVDPEVKTAARTSIWRFAWDIRGGDVIYVGDSKSKSMIARGFVTAESGARAYRYNTLDAITEPNKPDIAWRHEVPVEWDDDFIPFHYKDGVPRYTVAPFNPAWAHGTADIATPSESGDIDRRASEFLNETAYKRETQASQRNILKLHAALSNRFRSWLTRQFGVTAVQERNQVDLNFSLCGTTFLAELKICYGANTKSAIREALGQVFEYNHYPPRLKRQRWLIVLDHEPSSADEVYIASLRDRYQLPLGLAWEAEGGFQGLPGGSAS